MALIIQFFLSFLVFIFVSIDEKNCKNKKNAPVWRLFTDFFFGFVEFLIFYTSCRYKGEFNTDKVARFLCFIYEFVLNGNF